jgi:transcriptional regulator with XRE-family HTH domain
MADPFEGIGRALARLRQRAGFATQTQASEAVKFEKSQLSRWENENPRPTLENLGRLLEAYGATAQDFVDALAGVVTERAQAEYRGPSDEELIQALADAIRRVEGRQAETESRVERLEQDLNRTTG